MSQKSSWSRKLLLSTVVASQLLTTAVPVKAMWPTRGSPNDEGYAGAYGAGGAYYNTGAAAAAAAAPADPRPSAPPLEPLNLFLERIPTLSLADRLVLVPERWNAEESLESRMELLEPLFDLVGEVPKPHAWRQPFLEYMWKFFHYSNTWAQLSRQQPQMQTDSWLRGTYEQVSIRYHSRLIPHFGPILTDPEESPGLREDVAKWLSFHCLNPLNPDAECLDRQALPYFKRALEEPRGCHQSVGVKNIALQYVWGHNDRRTELSARDEFDTQRNLFYQRRRETGNADDTLIGVIRDKGNPESVRRAAVDALIKTNDPQHLQARYAEKLRPIYCQILQDPTEPETLRTFLVSDHLFFLNYFQTNEKIDSELMLMSCDFVKDPGVLEKIRKWAVFYLSQEGPLRELRRAPLHVDTLFFDRICHPTEQANFRKFLVNHILNSTLYSQEKKTSAQLSLVNFLRETDNLVLKAQVFESLWLESGPRDPLPRDELVCLLPNLFQRIPENVPGPIPIPFVLRFIASARQEEKADAIQRLKKHYWNPTDLALAKCLEDWLRFGGTTRQRLVLENVDPEERKKIFKEYIGFLLPLEEMPLTLLPSWRDLMEEAYPGDQDRLARVACIEEQRSVEQALHWLQEEHPMGPQDSFADAPLALVMLSGVVLEDTMLRRRVRAASVNLDLTP